LVTQAVGGGDSDCIALKIRWMVAL
jgi:hypothetical protein